MLCIIKKAEKWVIHVFWNMWAQYITKRCVRSVHHTWHVFNFFVVLNCYDIWFKQKLNFQTKNYVQWSGVQCTEIILYIRILWHNRLWHQTLICSTFGAVIWKMIDYFKILYVKLYLVLNSDPPMNLRFFYVELPLIF